MNKKGLEYNKEQYAFVFEESLLERLKTDDRNAIFKMWIAAFEADRLGYAISFFNLAEREGHPEASKFINLILGIAKKESDFSPSRHQEATSL